MAKTFARKFEPARRKFLKESAAIGGGLTVGFSFPAALAQKADATAEINAWVVIRPDDAIIIRYARSEMGQGSMTSAPMLVAEELECDWTRVKVEYASANANVKRKRVWGDMAAVGSRTIRNSQEYLRRAGATAREMLIAAAAQQWGVPASECSASNSFITHGAGGRRLSFGKVADAAAKLEAPKDVKLEDRKGWKLSGKAVKRSDIPDTVIGRQRYGIDVQLPGMLYAAIAQCPVFGGKVKSMDASKVEGRRGIVKVVPLETFVAVVADNWWRAKEALRDVHIEWDVGANGNVSSASLMEFYKGGLDAQTDVATARQDGDFDQAFASAAKKIEAEYYTPYLAHSCLEPMGCTAIVKDGKVDVWTSTQNAEASLANAAAAAAEARRRSPGRGFARRSSACDPERQDRIRAAQYARARRLLADGRAFAEPLRARVLYGRAGNSGGKGSLRIPARAARKIAERSRRARGDRESGGLGQAAAGGRVPRHRADRGLRQLHFGGRRALGRQERRGEDPPARARPRSRIRGQPGQRGGADAGELRVHVDRDVLGRDHHQGRTRRAVELPRLPHDAPARDAQCRGGARALGRVLGRRRRAGPGL